MKNCIGTRSERHSHVLCLQGGERGGDGRCLPPLLASPLPVCRRSLFYFIFLPFFSPQLALLPSRRPDAAPGRAKLLLHVPVMSSFLLSFCSLAVVVLRRRRRRRRCHFFFPSFFFLFFFLVIILFSFLGFFFGLFVGTVRCRKKGFLWFRFVNK